MARVARGAVLGAVLGTPGGPVGASAQQRQATLPLIFNGVSVIDVEHGKLVPNRRVVIVGNRIQAVGGVDTVKIPAGAQVVDARGKYLIPGLWDMHTHAHGNREIFYPLFVAYGVTGIRDASSTVPLQSLIQWRREILAGTRVGPPRQLFVGPALNEEGESVFCPPPPSETQVLCITPADARRVVDSLKTAGADMIKMYALGTEGYFAVAAEARRQGVPFGGHLNVIPFMGGPSAAEASDSGVSIIDHLSFAGEVGPFCAGAGMTPTEPDEKACKSLAERFRRNNTWWVPTLVVFRESSDQPGIPWSEHSVAIAARQAKRNAIFWPDSGQPSSASAIPQPGAPSGDRDHTATAGPGVLTVAQRVGMPILAGTDVTREYGLIPGLALHDELELMVAEGLTPLNALQSATLNPAKLLHATDSLGTVAPGKLADLVLLDADPLADITNTTAIRAVVANGRYFDRVTLDRMLAEAQERVKQEQSPYNEP